MAEYKNRNRFTVEEHGACGLVARFRKRNLGGSGGTYGVLQRTLDSLARLQQRGGSIQTDWGTDGDGAGVLTDIPPYICEKDLARAGLNENLAESLALGVFFVEPGADSGVVDKIGQLLRDAGLEVLYDRPVPRRPEFLGPAASKKEPRIVRFGLLVKNPQECDEKLFSARVKIDRELADVHVASLSDSSLVYKVMGTGKTLKQYYPELHNSQFKTHLAIAHIRMSTNTEPDFRLAHPYGTMVHNGEINTIDRLIRRARALGIPLPDEPSDTMVVDRIIQYLIARTGCSLATAYRMIFPLVDAEIEELPEREQKLQRRLKVPFGNLGQGPAGIIARYGDEALIGSDALALRPIWFGETEKELYATSERGAVDFEQNRQPPKPIAGGEHVLLDLSAPREVSAKEITQIYESDIETIFPGRAQEPSRSYHRFPLPYLEDDSGPARGRGFRRALGFSEDDEENIEEMAGTAEEPLGSVGYSPGGVSAAGQAENRLIADYCLERVAVITNPALDSERESRPFSLKVRFGDRGGFLRPRKSPCWEFPSPLVFSPQVEKLLDELKEESIPVQKVFVGRKPGENQSEALERLTAEAKGGEDFRILHLHDRDVLTEGRGLLDPLLALARVNRALREADQLDNTEILFESRRLRNLHDVMLAYGMGAGLVHPVMIENLCLSDTEDGEERLHNCLEALKTGMKKVISTMGIHEIEGYGRIFSSVGLDRELTELLEIDGYFGSEQAGLSLSELAERERRREEKYRSSDAEFKVEKTDAWPVEARQLLEKVASGELDYEEYENSLVEHRTENPAAIRHCLEIDDPDESQLNPDAVDVSVGESAAPLYFAAMSYGSTNVIPFTAYAEAGRELELLVVNGEGGEPEHLRSYDGPYRSQQLASGRFGINADLLANTSQVEIKIGQGAKPGEGGLLKGAKVNPHIAETRHTPPYIDLISPANNHDFYSIEDLIPTVINEMRVLNPDVKVDVKVPAIPELAPIVTGLAKEGHPDAVTISGYEGSTGAARRHAMRRVGFPAEVALNEAHRALCENGLRDRLELRVEGGMQSVDDVVKMGILGADRIGFGTLPMLATGCIYCGQCYTNRCPKGIASPFNSPEEAAENGVRGFQPRALGESVRRLRNFFGSMAEHLQARLAELGVERFTDLKDRTELLGARADSELDLGPLLEPVEHYSPPEENELIRDRLQTSVSSEQAETLERELSQNQDRSLSRLRFVTGLKNTDRAVGTGPSGVLARRRRSGRPEETIEQVLIKPGDTCVPGNGLGAFNEAGVELQIEGGAQDGTAKSMSGGRVVVLPGENNMGDQLDGSVGKSAAYGATGGALVVAGKYADSRFGVRCSGADLIHLGELTTPVADSRSLVNSRANLKGFAFEYMTSGRGLVLGDPGMELGAGMTGGVVYVKLNESLGLDRAAVDYRLADGVKQEPLAQEDQLDLVNLVDEGIDAIAGELGHKADRLEELREKPDEFVKVVPAHQPDPDLSFQVDPGEVVRREYEEWHNSREVE